MVIHDFFFKKIKNVFCIFPFQNFNKCFSYFIFYNHIKSGSDAETSGTHVAAEKNSTAFTFPVAPVSSMTVQPVGQPSSTFDTVVVPLKELNAAPPPPPVFSFDSKDHVKKAPPFTFSSLPPPAVGESFGLKFEAFSEPKPESSSRSVYIKCSKILGWAVSSLP